MVKAGERKKEEDENSKRGRGVGGGGGDNAWWHAPDYSQRFIGIEDSSNGLHLYIATSTPYPPNSHPTVKHLPTWLMAEMSASPRCKYICD